MFCTRLFPISYTLHTPWKKTIIISDASKLSLKSLYIRHGVLGHCSGIYAIWRAIYWAIRHCSGRCSCR